LRNSKATRPKIAEQLESSRAQRGDPTQCREERMDAAIRRSRREQSVAVSCQFYI